MQILSAYHLGTRFLYPHSSQVDKDGLRIMQRLPTLTDGQTIWRLPLSDTTATQLLKLLLLDDERERGRQCADLLKKDPALTLWTISQAQRLGQSAFRSTEELADWFGPRMLDVLKWPDEEFAEESSVSCSTDSAWSDLVAASVGTARCAAQFCDKNRHADEAYLAGLLHNSPQWMEASAKTRSCFETDSCGGSVTEALQQIHRSAAHDGAFDCVRQAIDRLANAQNEGDDLDEHRRYADNIAKEWSMPLAGFGRMLPALVARLSRARQLETSFQFTLQREKLAAMKELAYGASHEINNPLANISTRAQTLLRDESDPERRRKLAAINSQAFRAHEMISDMMLFAKPPRMHAEPMNVMAAIEDAITELSQLGKSQGTPLVNTSNDAEVVMSGDHGHLVVAIRALVQNSLEALGNGGRVEIRATKAIGGETPGEEWIEIQVHDNGPGIPAEVANHMFDPFYSGREAGRGLGFGLCKAWRIVEQHSGRIDYETGPEQGTTFTIRLPACLESQVGEQVVDAT